MNIVREVHDAVYAALKADTELVGKVNSIKDKPGKKHQISVHNTGTI